MQQKSKPRQVRCMLRARSRPDLGFFSLATSCAAPEVCGAVLGLVPAIQQDAERPLLPALSLRACIFRFENAFLQVDAVGPLEIFAGTLGRAKDRRKLRQANPAIVRLIGSA